jgi:hypothetical protein
MKDIRIVIDDRPIRFNKAGLKRFLKNPTEHNSKEDAEKIIDKLRELGYID